MGWLPPPSLLDSLKVGGEWEGECGQATDKLGGERGGLQRPRC